VATGETGRMQVIPFTLERANEVVARLHRHHKPVVGHRFSIGAWDYGKCMIVGAAIVGRPIARKVDQYFQCEVTRLVTDGTPNACSFLYGACARIAREMGFEKIHTKILESEPGTSLKASGWKLVGISEGGDWNRPSRGNRRVDQPMCKKKCWTLELRTLLAEEYDYYAADSGGAKPSL
jgi:hypothetical protein